MKKDSVQIKEVLRLLEDKVPLKWQEDYDNSGLQVGDTTQELSGILICLDPTSAVLDEAIRKKANLVISHHPLIFKQPLKQIVPQDKTGGLIFKAIENHICVYAMHTNLDKAEFGVSYKLAQKLALMHLSILEQEEVDGAIVGLGYYGDLKQPCSFDQFMDEVKQKLNLQSFKYQQKQNDLVRRVAVCGGSGASLIEKAYNCNSDVYITADLKYHEYMDLNYPLNILDIGHFESEVYAKDVIFDIICENFINFANSKSEDEMSSVKYY